MALLGRYSLPKDNKNVVLANHIISEISLIRAEHANKKLFPLTSISSLYFKRRGIIVEAENFLIRGMIDASDFVERRKAEVALESAYRDNGEVTQEKAQDYMMAFKEEIKRVRQEMLHSTSPKRTPKSGRGR